MEFLRRLVLFLIVPIGTTVSLHAMNPPLKYRIAIHNNVVGKLVNVPLQVSYADASGKTVTRIIAAGDVVFIGSADNFLPGAKGGTFIKFTGYGKVVGQTVKEGGLLPADLDTAWNKRKKGIQDPLIITVSSEQKAWLGPAELTFAYATTLPDGAKVLYDGLIKAGNPLAAFGRMRDWKLDSLLTVDELLKVPTSKWNEPLVGPGLIQRATRAEDACRYILGLDEKYTAADVQRAYNDLAFQWDPRKVEGQAAQKFSGTVLDLVIKARDVLKQSLKDRGLEGEWVEVAGHPEIT